MKSDRKIQNWLILATIIPGIYGLAGCAAKTVPIWGDPQTGLVLQYRLPEGQVLKYRTSGEQVESSDVMGQKINVESTVTGTYSFKSMGQKDSHLQLEVTIDGMSINTKSPQREFSPDMSPIIGKNFIMILSSLGEELDVSGAKSIQYEGPTGKRNLASRFQTLFPNPAGKSVKAGDSWTTQDAIVEEGETGKVTINFKNVHTLEGFETVEGMECARIKAKISGNLEGDGTQGGATYTVKGGYEGTDTWYFAYKEGILVKVVSVGVVDATVDVTSPQSLTIPTKQVMKMEITLIE
jgi:hypothetical protein